MAIRTFIPKEGGIEPRKKLKKLKSVKVANLDRLRLSMRKEKSRFDQSFLASSDDATDPSVSSSRAVSGTLSPNYMKATTSSSARKGSSQASPSTVLYSSASSSFTRASARKSNPVEIIRQKKSLKRVSSVKHVNKLSSVKSIKIRAKYSQFQENGNNAEFTMGEVISDYRPESTDGNYARDQESVIGDGDNQKSILKRSRSIKLTKLRSKRYSARLPKSRFGGAVEQMSYGEISDAKPHYMKGTSSNEARKNSAKGLKRTSSWRPLRILAKIPSLKPRKSRVRKRPQVTPLSRTGVGRATCSSTLKRSEFPDHIELYPGGRESEGTSSVHICPYTYCSLNGLHHHAPSPSLKEFISAKRKSLNNQKGKQLSEDVKHSTSTQTNDLSTQMVSTDIHAPQLANPTLVEKEEDDGLDFLITIYDKPRKKWAIEDSPSSDSTTLTAFTYNETSETDHDWELPEAPSEMPQPKGRQEALNEGLQETCGIFRTCSVEANSKNLQEISTTTSYDATETFISEEKIQSSGGDLVDILSDKQKYTHIWHLIYQQFVSSDAPNEGISSTKEKEGEDVNTCCEENELDQEQSKCHQNFNDSEDNQDTATENPDFNQTAALKLVQEGLNAILERDAELIGQLSKPGQDMTNSLAGECNLTPEAFSEENMKLGERPKKIKPTGYAMQQKVHPSEAEMPRQQMSQSYKKLRKIFVTAKIIKAMERMKRITPCQPRYLPLEPTSEEDKVFLRHLSRNEKKNTEEWMLDYALRWAISRLDPDQQRRVGQLVEAFETVTPAQREGIRHYATKSKPITTREKINPQQDDEGLLSLKSDPEGLRETHENQTIKTDSPLETPGNNCKHVDTKDNDECMVNEPMNIPEEPSQSPVGDSDVSHAGELSMMFLNKQKYTCMWNLIYQHVSSSETSMVGEQGDKVCDEEEQGGEVIKCTEINGLESATRSYSTNSKELEDEQKLTSEYKSNQSAAVKLVKEALDAILKRYEQSTEHQAIPVRQGVASYTDESLRKDSERVENHVNPEGEEKLHFLGNTNVSHPQKAEPGELKNPREMSKSYQRLKKAFVTAKFINAIQRLRTNSPRKSQSLPTEAGLKNERVYLRHLSIDGRRSDEECMLDYALRQVISKMTPDKQRRVAQLVKAFETVTPQQKETSLIGYPSGTESATVAQLATRTSVSLRDLTEEMHQRSISDEQSYQVRQNQNDGVLHSTKGASREISLLEDHDHKATPAGRVTLHKTVEAAMSETNTESSQISLISTPDVATEILSIGVEETTEDADAVSCFTTEGSEVKSENYIAPILFDKRKYTSMWNLIHQQVVSSEASKVAKQESNEVDEDSQEMNYPDSTHISNMEKLQNNKDSQSAVLNQSAAIKLVKEAIDAILQSHDQKFDQKTLQYDEEAAYNDAKGHCDTSDSAPTEENSQEGNKRAEKHRNPRTEDNLHDEDNARLPLQEQAEEKAAQRQRKNPNSHSKLKRLFVTAKFIAAMERLRKINWSKPQYLPPEAASVEERVYLRHLSIDGKKNHEEWMLDYALRHVISSLAPDQQRKVASLVEAFETVTPERKGNDFKYQTKDEFSPAINSGPINDEKEFFDSEESSMVYDGHFPQMQDDRFSRHKCTPLEKFQQEDLQTDISSIKRTLSSEAPESDQINLLIDHRAIPKGRPVKNPLTVRKETDASLSRTPWHASLSEKHQTDCEHNIGKGLSLDKRKTNGMWHLICQHLQSSSAAESGNKLGERLDDNENMKRDDTVSEMMTDADDYDDTDASSVTSELTENDAIKLVKETIDDILEEPRELDNELLSSLSTSALKKDQIVKLKPEKSQPRGYSKLRQLIICNKFIKTVQKAGKINPQKQDNPAIYSGAVAEKACLKNNGEEGKYMDEWMLDNVLQKAISGLAPAKQRRVALLVEAFEKVNPYQEERGTRLIHMKKKPADAIFLEGNTMGNGNTLFEASQHLSETPRDIDLTTDRIPLDISEGRIPSLRKEDAPNEGEMKGDTFKFTTLPSAAINTYSALCKDQTEVSCGDEQGIAPGEIEKQLVGYCDQVTKVAKKAFLPDGLKDEGIHSGQRRTSLDKENNTSLWSLILQHVKTDIPEKEEMQLSAEIETEDNTENSSQCSPEGIQDKEADIPNPTSFELYESEAIKLVQEAVNELLTLPEQADDNQSMSTSTTSEQDISNQVHSNGRETLPPNAAQTETIMESAETQEGEKVPPIENLPSTYSKLSRVIMAKRFIKAMNKIRQLKPQPPQELSRSTDTDVKGVPSLRQTETGEKNSWEEGMLDHALQKVVGKLAPSQKRRVASLVQAFETVSSQPVRFTSQRGKEEIS